ncbi:MAG TPA: hypothetical protein PKE04_23515, partial [Clostridia bacterium]|nr:hypothetical protein [Clostridia bacterium]
VYTDLLKNNPDGIPITTCMYLYHPKNAAIPMDQRNRLQLNLAYPTPEGYNAIVKWADSELSQSMPPFTIPTELVNEYANLGNEIKT